MWRPLGALVCQDKEDGTYCLCKYVNPPRPSPAYIKSVMNPGSALTATCSFVQLGWSSLLWKCVASPSELSPCGGSPNIGGGDAGRKPMPTSWPQPRCKTPHFCGSETGLVFTWILSALILTRVNAPLGAHPTFPPPDPLAASCT